MKRKTPAVNSDAHGRKSRKRKSALRTESSNRSILPEAVYPFHFPASDTGVTAQRAFQWLLHPLPIQSFFSDHFEKAPVVQRAPQGSKCRFECLLSVDDVRQLLLGLTRDQGPKERALLHGVDVDVTKYTVDKGRQDCGGVRGSPIGSDVWDKFSCDGCSIRLLRPQEHWEPIWALCSMLESFFGTVVGANVYLTPPSSQGFAPHYDDIDAFVCQVSGKKRWKVYAPRGDGHDLLPRRSSVDFTEEDMDGVALVYDSVLHPGDMLYLPRGCIHQAECPDKSSESGEMEGSLHVTLSACQKSTWTDLLMQTVAAAAESASHESVFLRKGLPLRFTDYVGVGVASNNESRRVNFDKGLRKALRAVADSYPIDAASDTIAERFMCERLPPWDVPSRFSGTSTSTPVGLSSVICAVGRNVARVVMDGDGEIPVLVHCLQNSRSSRAGADTESPVGRMTCTPDEALAINKVLEGYPKGVVVKDISLECKEDRLALAEILVELEIASCLPNVSQ